jgi:hypothetical protein
MADQAGQQEISVKEASFPSREHSRPLQEYTSRRGITSFNTSRRKKQCPTAQPRHLVDRAPHSSAEAMPLAALGPLLHQPHAAAQPNSTSPQNTSLVADRTPLLKAADTKTKRDILAMAL